MNAYEFLDTPGEFTFDKTSRTLYYYRAAAEDMTTATVFAPNNVTTLLRIAGTSTSAHARGITFSGLTVQHSDWNLVTVAGSVFKQAQQGNLGASAYAKGNFHVYYYRNVDVTPGIIDIANADGVILQRNRIQHTGADGVHGQRRAGHAVDRKLHQRHRGIRRYRGPSPARLPGRPHIDQP
jgi:hypothetical protein